MKSTLRKVIVPKQRYFNGFFLVLIIRNFICLLNTKPFTDEI